MLLYSIDTQDSFSYAPPTKKEVLIKLAIDRFGNVSCCVRFDPEGELRLGNLYDMTLEQCWNSEKRIKMREFHTSGMRKEIPYCGDKCEYWGVPTSD